MIPPLETAPGSLTLNEFMVLHRSSPMSPNEAA